MVAIIRKNSSKYRINCEIRDCKEHIVCCNRDIRYHQREIDKLKTEINNMNVRISKMIELKSKIETNGKA